MHTYEQSCKSRCRTSDGFFKAHTSSKLENIDQSCLFRIKANKLLYNEH